MIRQLPHNKPSHVLPLKLPRELIARIDEFATASGIKTRTGAIIRLITDALESKGV